MPLSSLSPLSLLLLAVTNTIHTAVLLIATVKLVLELLLLPFLFLLTQ